MDYPMAWGETQADGDADWWEETKIVPVSMASDETLLLKSALATACGSDAKLTQVALCNLLLCGGGATAVVSGCACASCRPPLCPGVSHTPEGVSALTLAAGPRGTGAAGAAAPEVERLHPAPGREDRAVFCRR